MCVPAEDEVGVTYTLGDVVSSELCPLRGVLSKLNLDFASRLTKFTGITHNP